MIVRKTQKYFQPSSKYFIASLEVHNSNKNLMKKAKSYDKSRVKQRSDFMLMYVKVCKSG